MDLLAEVRFLLETISKYRDLVSGFGGVLVPPQTTKPAPAAVTEAVGQSAVVVSDDSFVRFVFGKIYPGVAFPGDDDPRVRGIYLGIEEMRSGNTS